MSSSPAAGSQLAGDGGCELARLEAASCAAGRPKRELADKQTQLIVKSQRSLVTGAQPWAWGLPPLASVLAPFALLAITAGLLTAWVPCDHEGLLKPFGAARCGAVLRATEVPLPAPFHALRKAPAPGQTLASGAARQAPGPAADDLGPPADPWLRPSKQVLARLQADPNLATEQPELLGEFEAAPWLLPPQAAALLPYAGQHDLDSLLEQRAAPLPSPGGSPGGSRAVALLPFSASFGVLVQNCVYSLVKMGGATNYLAFTWTPADLAACAALNLPCADASSLLLPPATGKAPAWGSFNAIQWLKAAVTLRALRRGLVTMLTDTDVAFAAKPVWASLLNQLELSSADGIFQSTGALTGQTLNTGTYVLLPTPGCIAAIEMWNTTASRNTSEQLGMALWRNKAYADCEGAEACKQARSKMSAGAPPALFQRFTSAQSVAEGKPGNCALANASWSEAHPLNLCAWFVLFLHPVCMGSPAKPRALHRQRMWFLDDPLPGAPAGCVPWNATPAANAKAKQAVPLCRPLFWRVPGAEDALRRCRPGSLGLVPPDVPPGPLAPPPMEPP